MSSNDKIVYVVHAIDTEGPLYVDLDAKFETLEGLLDLRGLERSEATLEAIRSGKIDLGPKGDMARSIVSSHRNNYMGDWAQLDVMLDHAMSREFRTERIDSFGGGYVYSWFCLDHIGYVVNPRRRQMGFHKVHDYYANRIAAQENSRGNAWERDGLQWHFHPMSTNREAHRCGTSLLNSPHIMETLARRIIERHWFPAAVRCGFRTERPDIHWFLEQYVPFDFTNTSTEDSRELDQTTDLEKGRFGDWRMAPKDWSVYQPSHDNYQVPGNCRRYIARALNILNRCTNIDAFETEKAFERAASGMPTLLAISSHDFRDLAPEVDALRDLLSTAQSKFPEVRFKFSEATEAMRAVVHGRNSGERLALDLTVDRAREGRPAALVIRTVRGTVFGPQPFLSLQTRDGRFIHDNLDLGDDGRSWRYALDHETVTADNLAAAGVGAADRFGNTDVRVVKFDD